MSEAAAMTEAGDAAEAAPSRDEVIAALEQRVRRLEDALAAVQDTTQLEERVVERITKAAPPAQPVAAPVATPAPAPAPVAAPDSTDLLMHAGRHLLPAAVGVIQAEARAADAHAAAAPGAREPWLLLDAYAELRAMVRMYVDRRYRMTWVGRTVPLVLVIALLTSWIWFPGLSAAFTVSQLLGLLLMKPVDLVLAYFLIRILGREARRYRETISQLQAYVRA
jgi:hypothetical protein